MKTYLICILFFPVQLLFAQGKYDANWVFGVKAGIDFNDTTNSINFPTFANNFSSAANISDSLGQLLFYYAPDTPFNLGNIIYGNNYGIYGADNLLLSNGDSIISATGGIFLKIPDQQDTYYFFSLSGIDSSSRIFSKISYSIIKKDVGGRFAVIEKNGILSNYPLELNIAAVKHADGTNWWLIVHEQGTTNNFVSFLVTANAISGPYTQSIGTSHNSQFSGAVTQLNFSSDGNWLVNTLLEQNSADLFSFDRCSGQLNNFIKISNIDGLISNGKIYGCEFSKSNDKLYLSEGCAGPRNGLYQYKLDTSDINASKKIIWQDTDVFTSGFAFGDLRRAPNNKIYLAMLAGPVAPYSDTYFNPQNQNLWVINEPDSSGAACSFQPYGYYLGDSARTYYALPNMPNYNLGPISVYAATAGENKVLCSDSMGSVIIGTPPVPSITYSWSPSKGLNDSTIAQPTARPDTDTYYILTVMDTSQSGSLCNSRSDTVFVRVRKCDTVGIGEIVSPVVKVYPNPCSSVLNVELPFVSETAFCLFDLVGRAVLEQPEDKQKLSIDVSSLPQGLYFYRTRSVTGKVWVLR